MQILRNHWYIDEIWGAHCSLFTNYVYLLFCTTTMSRYLVNIIYTISKSLHSSHTLVKQQPLRRTISISKMIEIENDRRIIKNLSLFEKMTYCTPLPDGELFSIVCWRCIIVSSCWGVLLSRDDGQENNRMYEMMSKSDMKFIIIERFSVSGLKIKCWWCVAEHSS